MASSGNSGNLENPGNSGKSGNFFDKVWGNMKEKEKIEEIIRNLNINTNVEPETLKQKETRAFQKRIAYKRGDIPPIGHVQPYYDLLLSIYKNKDVELIKRLAKVTNYRWPPYLYTIKLQAVCSLLDLFISATPEHFENVNYFTNLFNVNSEEYKINDELIRDTFQRIIGTIRSKKPDRQTLDDIRLAIETNFPRSLYSRVFGYNKGGTRKRRGRRITKKNSRRVKPQTRK
jgi:hypothetical protein